MIIYMNVISPNTAAQYNIERKIEIENIQVIQKKLHKVYAYLIHILSEEGYCVLMCANNL